MSSKDKYGKFKKKDYVRMIDNVRYYLCRKFGYKIKPYIFETQLDENVLMMFAHTACGYEIFYDYKQFKETFGHRDFEAQEAYAAAIMAHEMRHYINDAFKKIIIVKDSMKPHYNQYGVYIIGLYDFLLNINSLDF